jgi:hypothetical protein
VRKAKIWQKAREQYLYKHVPTGIYYARSRAGGVDKWITLDTTVLSVAEQRVADKVKELKKGHKARKDLKSGEATFGQVAGVYLSGVAFKLVGWQEDPEPAEVLCTA